MKKLILTIITLIFLSGTAHAGACVPFAIAEAIKTFGQPANYKIIHYKLGKSESGYYTDEVIKKYLDYKKVKKIDSFPVIVEKEKHVYTVFGEIGAYYRVKDIMCEKKYNYCLYKKSKVMKEKIDLFKIINIIK